MLDKIRLLIFIISLVSQSIALSAGRNVIREEIRNSCAWGAVAVTIENRFTKFYNDEAIRKQTEQDTMQLEIQKAKDAEAAMLKELEQSLVKQSNIQSADELEQRIQQQLGDVNDNNEYSTNPSASLHAKTGRSYQDNLFVNDDGGKAYAPLAFANELKDKDFSKRAAGIKEVVTSLQGLPGQQQLAQEFARDLNKISPEIAQQFTASYNESVNTSTANGTRAQDSTFFDLKYGNKENNPLLFLQDLQNADPTAKASGMTEVISGLKDLPDRDKLLQELTKDLAKLSPAMAKEFTDFYQNISSEDVKLISDTTGKKAEKSANQKDGNHNQPQITKNMSQTQYQLASKFQDNLGKTFNAITNYHFSPDKLYQIYTSPHKVTVIVLAPGEKIIGAPICGDPVKWKIATIKSSNHTVGQHLTIQPLRTGLTTSISIATNQGRLYLLEATSLPNNYMAVVRWGYEL